MTASRLVKYFTQPGRQSIQGIEHIQPGWMVFATFQIYFDTAF